MPCFRGGFGIRGKQSTSSSLTINGTGFGVKSTAVPVYFNNFEADAVGDHPSVSGAPTLDPIAGLSHLQTSGNWTDGVSTAQPHSGIKSLRVIYANGDSGFPNIGITMPAGSLIGYQAGWTRWQGAAGGTPHVSVFKWGRMGCNAPYFGNPKCYFTLEVAGGAGDTGITKDAAGTSSQSFSWGPGQPETVLNNNVDHFIEYGYKLSTPGSADGILFTKVNGTPYVNQLTLQTRDAGENSTLSWVIAPIDGADTVSVDTLDLYLDEWLIDNTFARVIVTNNATYASSTKFAPQPITTWSNTQITISSPNWSNLSSGAAFAHVWDASNNYIGATSVTVP